KSYANIVKANALRIDWKEIFEGSSELGNEGSRSTATSLFPYCSNSLPNYIIGNPPFVGYSNQTKNQKLDMQNLFVENGKPYKKAGKIDYVAGWYLKAAEFMKDNAVRAAFVSTNSVTQGEQAVDVWKFILNRAPIHFDFAYKTFRWESESADLAHVHCVIIGFSVAPNDKPKKIFSGNEFVTAKNINFYLLDSEMTFIENRVLPICEVPQMTTGNRPADGGALIIEEKDYADFIKREPAAQKFIKRLIGSEEFINGKLRYCLWLVDATPAEIRKLKLIYQRVQLCKENRLKGAPDRQKLAATPHLFRETKNPAQCIVVPKVSGDRRFYIPMDIVGDEVILTDLLFMIPDGQLYHFGVLMSSIHMAWTRVTCGRMGTSYRYSATIVYNNFIWCTPTPAQKKAIESTAKNILDVRAKYQGSKEVGKKGNSNKNSTSLLRSFPNSLAALYDELTMPKDLREAHRANDKAVAAVYGFENILDDEPAIVAELFRLYDALTKN
ncbi:MAG: hypothetical protein IKT98_04420, partial [Selenomonadaceae bacterium]|nr:hypothetical protein [Selenomonadaceae bacterium]